MGPVKLGKKNVVVVDEQSVRVGARGQAQPVGALYRELSKGERRQLRKQFRARGHVSIAAAPTSAARR